MAVSIGQLEKKVVELEATQHSSVRTNQSHIKEFISSSIRTIRPTPQNSNQKEKVVKSESGNWDMKVIITPCIPQSSVLVLQTTIQKPVAVVERN